MIRRFSLLAFAAAMLLPALTARASLIIDMPTIDVGDWTYEEGTGVVEIPIYIVGDAEVTDLAIRAQIGDGAPDLGGTPGMPVFVGVDYTGSIWGAITPDTTQTITPQYVNSGTSMPVTLPNTRILLDGLLITLRIDLTGLTAGQSFSLKLDGVDPTYGYDGIEIVEHEFDITNGTINIVPEPASLALIGAGLLLMLRRRVA